MYLKNYHKAVESVIGKPNDTQEYYKLFEEFKLNTAKVAAFKAHDATNVLKILYKSDPEKFEENSKIIEKTYTRYQAAEYNTTTARCRSAVQFEQFAKEKDLYPNIEWLPTSSSTPRELHASFVGLVLPQDDPFWQNNQPGNLYNCKCDWRSSDKQVSQPPAKAVPPARGLEGNPATTGQIFSDKHSYFERAKPNFKKNDVANLFYTDLTGKFDISVIADKTEIADNVSTARILLANFPEMDIKIREDWRNVKHGVKNPEYLIDETITDAKRIKKYTGIKNGFADATTQGFEAIIIDLNKHMYGVDLDLVKLQRRLEWRHADFETGKIKKCYVVYKNKAILITSVKDKLKLAKELETLKKP